MKVYPTIILNNQQKREFMNFLDEIHRTRRLSNNDNAFYLIESSYLFGRFGTPGALQKDRESGITAYWGQVCIKCDRASFTVRREQNGFLLCDECREHIEEDVK